MIMTMTTTAAAASVAATNTAFSDYNSCSFIVKFIVQCAHDGGKKNDFFSLFIFFFFCLSKSSPIHSRDLVDYQSELNTSEK